MFDARVRDQWIAPTVERYFSSFSRVRDEADATLPARPRSDVFRRSDPLIANRHVDLAPAPVQRSRSRSMDRSCHSSGISAFSRIRSESNATVPARPRRDVFRRSDPLIANRHVDLAPAPVQRARSRSMDRSCGRAGYPLSRGSIRIQCHRAGPTTTRCFSSDPLSQERSGIAISAFSRISARSESNATAPARPRRDVFRRSDPLIANRHVDLAPAPVQRPRSRSMDRSCTPGLAVAAPEGNRPRQPDLPEHLN
jgi:hypothetical protein